MNSDAVVFFLDVLPILPTGVLVGIHDIYVPDDYLPAHAARFYSEQYLLASYLLGGSRWFRPELALWWASGQPQLREIVAPLLEHENLVGLAAPRLTFWAVIDRQPDPERSARS